MLWVSGYWQAVMLLMDVPGFLLGQRNGAFSYWQRAFPDTHVKERIEIVRAWAKAEDALVYLFGNNEQFILST